VDGQLQQQDGRWRLRFERRLAHPPEKVWLALSEPEHLAAWFPTDIQGDRVAGAPLRFEYRDYHLDDQEPPWNQVERWSQVHETYVEGLGPDASTIGPPEWSSAHRG
jgi:uncharacterized protein YndB with AHSA1/START domain